MDAITLIISFTLAVAGIFLFRDYTRFLKSAYAKHGKVVSIQQKFYTHQNSDSSNEHSYFVENGFYPVIECPHEDGAICFTAIDNKSSGNLHVGDLIDLKITKTRRQTNRTCKTLIALSLSLVALVISLIDSTLTGNIQASLGHVVLTSTVIAAGLSILVLNVKNQDENSAQTVSQTKNGHTQIYLSEPTAFKNWKSARLDPIQKSKIRHSQLCGATFLGSAFVMFAITMQPVAQIFLKLI